MESSTKLMCLPDEILMTILMKLNTIDAFNLIGISNRLDSILQDRVITNHLTLFKWSSNDLICQLDDKLADLFCLQILPKIHNNIKSLNLELLSMERIFLSTNYPNLCTIGLYNIDQNTATHLFHSNHSFLNIYKNKISSIIIKLDEETRPLLKDTLTNIFTYILEMFDSLHYLNFEGSSVYHQQVSFGILPSKSIFSSNLLNLHLNLKHFNDCLYLLDGRFNKLHTLDVKISSIRSDRTIENKEKLFNLKRFALTCDVNTNVYDESIVPLLRRMLNLEKLDLYLVIIHKETLIDGNDLECNIINYLSHLKKFQFNIHSFISIDNPINLQPKEDIRHTLRNIENNRIISYVNYYPESRMGYCNIYSYPCSNRMRYYYNVTNNFPGGLYKYVRKISLFDEYSFEHEFFIRISQAFPFMKSLSLTNHIPQKNKQSEEPNLSIVQFIHLNELNFDDAHDDYIEQFLVDTKTSLPNNISLGIEYHQLTRVTHDFTRPATRNNCEKCCYKYCNHESNMPKDI